MKRKEEKKKEVKTQENDSVGTIHEQEHIFLPIVFSLVVI